jgi:hypothetical protein
MKNLLSLAVLTALVAFGGAFVGKWKIPGLENLPTAESLKFKSKHGSDPTMERAAERRLEQEGGANRPTGYFATDTNSAGSNRKNSLRNAGKDMGVE